MAESNIIKATARAAIVNRKPIPRERFRRLFEISAEDQRAWLSDLPTNTRISGIYEIINEMSGKIYVGSSVDCQWRWRDHAHRLRQNEHPNRHLQAAWNLYGQSAFRFEIVEIVSDSQKLLESEQTWLDKYPPRRLYNKRAQAESNRGWKPEKGIPRPNSKGKPKSAQHRARLAAHLNQVRPTGPHSIEHREKIATAQRGRSLTPEHRANIAAGQRKRHALRRELATLPTDRPN